MEDVYAESVGSNTSASDPATTTIESNGLAAGNDGTVTTAVMDSISSPTRYFADGDVELANGAFYSDTVDRSTVSE